LAAGFFVLGPAALDAGEHMSVWQNVTPSHPPLFGSEGELVSISICVDPHDLESLLDTLAQLDFPINPEICHDEMQTVVDFPAYASRLEQVRKALLASGFDPNALRVAGMLEKIRARATAATH
jgi:hypothetical protein